MTSSNFVCGLQIKRNPTDDTNNIIKKDTEHHQSELNKYKRQIAEYEAKIAEYEAKIAEYEAKIAEYDNNAQRTLEEHRGLLSSIAQSMQKIAKNRENNIKSVAELAFIIAKKLTLSIIDDNISLYLTNNINNIINKYCKSDNITIYIHSKNIDFVKEKIQDEYIKIITDDKIDKHNCKVQYENAMIESTSLIENIENLLTEITDE